MRFGIIWFSSVKDTEASVFSYLLFTRFGRPLMITINEIFPKNLVNDITFYIFSKYDFILLKKEYLALKSNKPLLTLD